MWQEALEKRQLAESLSSQVRASVTPSIAAPAIATAVAGIATFTTTAPPPPLPPADTPA